MNPLVSIENPYAYRGKGNNNVSSKPTTSFSSFRSIHLIYLIVLLMITFILLSTHSHSSRNQHQEKDIGVSNRFNLRRVGTTSSVVENETDMTEIKSIIDKGDTSITMKIEVERIGRMEAKQMNRDVTGYNEKSISPTTKPSSQASGSTVAVTSIPSYIPTTQPINHTSDAAVAVTSIPSYIPTTQPINHTSDATVAVTSILPYIPTTQPINHTSDATVAVTSILSYIPTTQSINHTSDATVAVTSILSYIPTTQPINNTAVTINLSNLQTNISTYLNSSLRNISMSSLVTGRKYDGKMTSSFANDNIARPALPSVNKTVESHANGAIDLRHHKSIIFPASGEISNSSLASPVSFDNSTK